MAARKRAMSPVLLAALDAVATIRPAAERWALILDALDENQPALADHVRELMKATNPSLNTTRH